MTRRFPPLNETLTDSLVVSNASHETTRRPPEAGSFASHAAFIEYEKIHKRFVGPRTANKLLRIHDDLADEANVDWLVVAGWAAAEAALVATDRDTAERMEHLEKASDAWENAVLLRREENARRGLAVDSDDARMVRLQLPRIFLPVMEGMILGDITKETRAGVYDDLLTMTAQNAVGHIEAARRGEEAGLYIGIGHELNAMLAVNRLQSPTLMAMPALARADSGRFHPEQTHDIELLHLNWGEIRGVTTLESKARPKERHYKRYEAAIINGSIHLYTSTGSSPVDTALLFLKEQHDQLTDDEFEELERMTDTIVHLARHQQSGSPDVPHQCRDISRCEVVPQHRSGKLPPLMGGLAVASGM